MPERAERARAGVGGAPIGRGATVLIGALLLMGALALAVESQSPSRLYWTGDQVTGSSQGGIITYGYAHGTYTIDDPAHSSRDTQAVPAQVWVDPAEPGQALPDNVVRWVDAAFVAVWFVAAAAVVPFAYRRQQRRRRRQQEFASFLG